jgi:hypothetical protein
LGVGFLGTVEAVKITKRQMAEEIIGAKFGFSYEEVLDWARSCPTHPLWQKELESVRDLDIECQLIIGTFTDNEAALLSVDVTGQGRMD